MRLPFRLLWVTLGLCGVLALPAYFLGGTENLTNMFLGAGLSLVAIVVSYFILTAIARDIKRFQVVIAVGGFLLRMVFLVVIFYGLANSFDVNLTQLIAWLVTFYIVLVIFEGFDLEAQARQLGRRQSRPSQGRLSQRRSRQTRPEA